MLTAVAIGIRGVGLAWPVRAVASRSGGARRLGAAADELPFAAEGKDVRNVGVHVPAHVSLVGCAEQAAVKPARYWRQRLPCQQTRRVDPNCGAHALAGEAVHPSRTFGDVAGAWAAAHLLLGRTGWMRSQCASVPGDSRTAPGLPAPQRIVRRRGPARVTAARQLRAQTPAETLPESSDFSQGRS